MGIWQSIGWRTWLVWDVDIRCLKYEWLHDVYEQATVAKLVGLSHAVPKLK